MRIFAFDERSGRELDAHGSRQVVFSRIANLTQNVSISYMAVRPQGVIGYHQAAMPQLFLVVEGSGWVRGKTEKRQIQAGEAAYWGAGEWHESGSEKGMKAIIIEMDSEKFDPAEFILELEE